MKYRVKSFKSDVEFIDESNERIDECALRSAIERQVIVTLGVDKEEVHVSPFEITAREVIRCNHCEEIDATVSEQQPAVSNKGTEDEQTLEHACHECLAQYRELEATHGER